MAVAADPIRVHFRPAGEIVHGASHVEDILPGEALSLDDVAQEQEPLEIATSQSVRLLPLLETERVGAQHDVAFAGQRHARVMHRVSGQSGRFALAQMPFAVVLVPHANARRGWQALTPCGNEQVRGNSLARLRLER